MRTIAIVAAAVGVLAAPVSLHATEKYPERAVKMVVPFPAGGPTDVTARIIAQGLSERLGKQFYVENVGGAGGNTGTAQVARAAPDGYTIVVVSTGFVVNPSLYVKVPYDALKDFAAVTLAAASPNVLIAHPSVPANTLQEFVEEVKKNPGKYSFGGPGTGSTPHLSGELFKLHFKLDYTYIPFTGAAPTITSTMGGHTPTAWTALPPALEPVRGGKLKAFAVTSAKRHPALPDVPTLAEAGIQGQEADTLTGVLVPAGTPKPIIDRLHKEIAALVAVPEVKAKLAALGFESIANTPEEFTKRIELELKKWAKVIEDAKIPRIQ